MEEEQINEQDIIRLISRFQKSPIYFIRVMWDLTPQPIKPEFEDIAKITPLKEYKAEWFDRFEKGKHVTWQQWVMLLAIEAGLRGDKPKRISVASGHGIGKDAFLSWLILWYLYCFEDAQVPCTAPTSEQIHDILWKEIAIWLARMPKEASDRFEWQSGHIRMRHNPETWFARARTARKENPEAFAGVHGDYVLFVGDEACHDDKTEVLTNDGWKLFVDLDKNDLVMTMNPKTGMGEWQKPTEHFEYDHTGKMYGIKAKTGDFMITGNHELWAKSQKAGYRKIKVKDVNLAPYYSPRVINWIGKKTIARDMMALWGWYLSEGNLKYLDKKAYAISISQNNETNREEIIDLVKRLGYKPGIYRGAINIHSVELCKQFEVVGGGFKDKYIPLEIKEQTPELLNVFLDAFIKGDGYKKGNRDIIYTSSPRLADDIQEIILKTGKNSVISKRKIKGQKKWIIDHWATSSCDGYVISRSYIDTHLKIDKKKLYIRDYIGKVYCVSVPDGIIMTRRNGKTLWSGNSGIPNEIYSTAEGALTQENAMAVLVSNFIRGNGYFFDTHHSDSYNWQTFVFDSRESPIVDWAYVERIKEKYGIGSDEWRKRVTGQPPKEGTIDAKGYVPLFSKEDFHYSRTENFVGLNKRMGIDPAGAGRDKTEWVGRDSFKIRCLLTEPISTPKTIAVKSLLLFKHLGILPENTWVDNFGEGANVAQEIAMARKVAIRAVSFNDKPSQPERFLNKRAEMYFTMKNWMKIGGEIVRNQDLEDQLLSIRYTETIPKGKYKLMSKMEMKSEGYPSPDKADAAALTFYIPDAVDGRDAILDRAEIKPGQMDPYKQDNKPIYGGDMGQGVLD